MAPANTVIPFDRHRAGAARRGAHPLAAALAQALVQAPPRPAGLIAAAGQLAQEPVALAANAAAQRTLRHLRQDFFAAPGREAAMEALWSSSVVTAVLAARLGGACGRPAAEAGAAGLLHRVGDVWALAALARAETAARLRLPDIEALRLVTGRQADLAPRLASAWALDGEISAGLLQWPAWPEDEAGSAVLPLPAIVYFAHLLAVELAWPASAAPFAVNDAAEDAGLPPALLEDCRSLFPALRTLLARIG